MKPLLLFDIDHTLLRNAPGHKEAFTHAFKEVYGVDATMDYIEHAGMTDQLVIKEVLLQLGFSEKKILSKLDECVKSISSYYLKIKDGLPAPEVLNGVKKLLPFLEKKKCLLGLVTGNLEEIGYGKMELVGLRKYFKLGGFGSDHMIRSELVKLAIKRAVKEFDFKIQDHAYVIGDTPKDILAGKEGGAKTIGVATGTYSISQLEKAGADYVLKDLTDSKKVVEIIENKK